MRRMRGLSCIASTTEAFEKLIQVRLT